MYLFLALNLIRDNISDNEYSSIDGNGDDIAAALEIKLINGKYEAGIYIFKMFMGETVCICYIILNKYS